MKLFKKIKSFVKIADTRTAGIYASSACFYMILSVIPISLLITALLTRIPGAPVMIQFFLSIIPEQPLLLIMNIVQFISSINSAGILSISGLLALWSASKWIYTIQNGLRGKVQTSPATGYIRSRLQAIWAMILFGITLILILVAFTLGKTILQLLGAHLHTAGSLYGQISSFHYAMPYPVFIILLSASYRVLLYPSLTLRYAFFAGTITSLCWIIFAFGFSFYVNYISKKHFMYGALGLLLLFCLWLYWNIKIFLSTGYITLHLQNNNPSVFRSLQALFLGEF